MSTLLIRFTSSDGQNIGPTLSVSRDLGPEPLLRLLNEHILKNPYYVHYRLEFLGSPLTTQLSEALRKAPDVTLESVLAVAFFPEDTAPPAIAGVLAEMPGHASEILCLSFSPGDRALASGSGDRSARLWDLETFTPTQVLAHEARTDDRGPAWVLVASWSPDGGLLATGTCGGALTLWDAINGTPVACNRAAHGGHIAAIAWETGGHRLITAGKDGVANLWDRRVGIQRPRCVLAGHTQAITAIAWDEGRGLVVTASRDRTARVHRIEGECARPVGTFKAHAHWINAMDIDRETGRAATGAEDGAAALWDYANGDQASGRIPHKPLLGHTRGISAVAFSPNRQFVATASFDRTIKLWSGAGAFIATLRGHVAQVYRLAWSPCSRRLVSASADSTLKLWCTRGAKLQCELPGHADEVYAVVWGRERVVSGGKDGILRVWGGEQ